jgi:coenzyme F420-reducing hydrogenase delta subunit
MTAHSPRLIGFLCNWCSYAGADLCGVSRYQYPTNLRTVRVMCSARVEPGIVLEMFIQGADGVFVGGCHIGDCHYIKGNYYAQLRMELAKKLLVKAGMDPKRLRLEWVSASEGERFARLIGQFTEELSALGPSPVAGDEPDITILENLYVAKNLSEDFRLRAIVGKELDLIEKGNVFGKKVEKADFDRFIDSVIEDEFARCRILLITKYRPHTTGEIAEAVDISPRKVLQHIVTLRERGLIVMDKSDGSDPMYIAATMKEVLK